MQRTTEDIIRQAGLRATTQRKTIVQGIEVLGCASPRDIETWIAKHGVSINTVTVYRVLEALERVKLLHRLRDGRVSLCSMPDTHGHHAMLHCTQCDAVTEFHDERICKSVGAHAKSSGFSVEAHNTEILGVCTQCA